MTAKKICILFAALLLGISSLAHAVLDCDTNGQSVNPSDGNSTAGKSGVMRCKYRDSGEMQREQEVQNGVFMGLVRFYQNGKLFKEHRVNAKGNMEGPAREFASNGKVVRESAYVNGDEVGLVRTFYPSGTRRSIMFNAEGRREAASVEFTEAGKLSALRCADKPMLAPAFDDAHACGFSDGPSQLELFDAKGTLRERVSYGAGKRLHWEGLYDNGQPETSGETVGDQSVGRRFWPNGRKRHEVYSLVNGRRTVRQRELEYSERGTLVHEQRWSLEGTPTNDNSFYLNGQPRSQSVYRTSGEQRFVDISEFYDSGERSAVGRFRAGLRGGGSTPVGTHQTFDPNGALATEIIYD